MSREGSLPSRIIGGIKMGDGDQMKSPFFSRALTLAWFIRELTELADRHERESQIPNRVHCTHTLSLPHDLQSIVI